MAANKCSAASASAMAGPIARDQAGQVMSLASAVAHLNTVSAGVSVEPTDYNWGAPSFLQQQALYSQFLQLAFMCSLPQMQYAHLSACPTLQPGRPTMFPGFMPPLSGFLPPVAAPCPALSPSPAPCSPAGPQASGQQPGKASSGRPEAPSVKPAKAASPSKKSGAGSKTKLPKSATAVTSIPAGAPAGAVKVEPDIELEDICRLLGDDAFLEHLQDDVLSEGSNGSSSASDGRVLSKNNSNGSLSGSLNNNEGGLFVANNFASAFDLDMDEAPVAAAVSEEKAPAPPTQPPLKASSGDLNNMVASSPTRLTRSSRSAAREAAAAKDTVPAAVTVPATKISLKVNKGGVQKVTSSKPTKVLVASAVPAQQQPASEECPLTAADLSRLLGEDDNRIPDGWDLDLDFENPFSCSISAF